MFTKAGLKSTKKWMEFYMGDSIRNKAIFKTKIAKIPQKLPKFDILKNDSNVAQWGRTFLLTLQKKSGDSTMYSY